MLIGTKLGCQGKTFGKTSVATEKILVAMEKTRLLRKILGCQGKNLGCQGKGRCRKRSPKGLEEVEVLEVEVKMEVLEEVVKKEVKT